MRKANVFMHGKKAGSLVEYERHRYGFQYDADYSGPAISLTLPLQKEEYIFYTFPAFFDGLLPEGVILKALLQQKKIDQSDCFSQLMAVGDDLVGAVSVQEVQSK